jgi:hypothetical protein
MHGCMCYFACYATFAMTRGPPKEVKLDELWRGREREVKLGGSTKTNTNYHLLEVLVLLGVLLQTNTKITSMHGSFMLVWC